MRSPRDPGSSSLKPWYREPWPWILMAGPVIVIVAGAFTMTLAFTHQDELVATDYYRKLHAVAPAKAGAQLDPRLRGDDKQ